MKKKGLTEYFIKRLDLSEREFSKIMNEKPKTIKIIQVIRGYLRF